MIAVALDPGVTTGYCVAYLNKDKLYVGPDERKFTLASLYNFLTWFRDQQAYVIYEDFQYRNASRGGLNLTPVKMIGVIELVAEDSGVEVFKQTPAQGKGYWTDQKLKDAGVYKVGKAHGRDATRHLLQWAKFGPGSEFIKPHTMLEMIDVGEIYNSINTQYV